MNFLADESVDQPIVNRLSAAIREHASKLAGAFTVISPGIVRIRGTP